ncbi:uncharacterized protein LOC123308987 isoform X2 [Coccinella septempunctata]|uniref:uncharacterized protein LOC123308987 isoform X2 n=1 Tax=Coccinella septempunctata TaxID=41139 RepID=UPI001D05ECCF|nr:uncharacterized protein LOC123308987 isoform X2 [Coccinella septempunctata]
MVSEDVKAYVSSLADLTFNSKPLINMLTMLADENVAHAAEIVDVVEDHLAKVKTDVKLPVLYLIDCIVKNVGGPYNELFSRNIVATFCNVFRVVDEKTRAEMFKLRQTWNEVFSPKKLYAIDVQIRVLDPAWPVTAPVPKNCIHLNPKFLKNTSGANPNQSSSPVIPNIPANTNPTTLDMQQQLIQKQKELLELQQKKLELELLQTKVRLREQISANTVPGASTILPQVSGTKNQRMQFQTANSGPKIQPANSALVAAAINRPIRDPRLLRQQQNQQMQEKQTLNTANTNVQIENKNNSETSNKIVNSKTSVRDIQKDPRLKNIDNAPPQKFTDVNKPKSKLSPKSKSDRNQTRSSRLKNQSDDPKLSSKSTSNASLDSPKKSKSDKSSPSKSQSSRSSRKEVTSPKSKLFRSAREAKISKSDTALPVFKDVKNSKNRNYVRRNRSPQFSPEISSQDIDLRLNGPPEKQLRLASASETSIPQVLPEDPATSSAAMMDVDLRQLPPAIGKKRASLDSLEVVPNKKTRTEIFDELFGNEDTDLRKFTVPTPDRPPTPPPPIISSSDVVVEPQKEPQQPKSDLQTVRAKLAANLKKSNSPLKRRTEDEDLRMSQVSSSTDISNKIIISKAEGEKIKEGGMNSVQQKQLMNKIIAQIEAQKLKEAKQKNFEENAGNISLTPISDDELDTDFNEENNRSRKESPVPGSVSFGDKDERVLLPQPVVSQPDDAFNKRFGREIRRGVPLWRGARGRRHWEAPHPRPPMRPWMQQPPMNKWGPGMFRPPFPEMEPSDRRSPDGPNDIIIESASQEDIKTITIDGLPRDIRYYDEVAIIFMNWDDPREISFQDGTRRVIFNDTDMYMMNFNEPYRELRIGESLHQVRLGGPSREIYIDYKPYECYFGGPGITIDLNGKVTSVKLDGPPPQVKIGESRTDLVAGKIKLIIDAKTIIPIFLDSRVQTFNYNGERHTVQFLPGLKSVLINNENFDVQFGGLPKPIMLKDRRHYIRFSVLPKALKLGHIKIKGLESADETSSPSLEENLDVNEPALPIPQRAMKAYDPNISPDNSSSSNLFQNVLQQQNLQNLDFLTNVISTTEEASNTYQVESNPPTQQPESASNPTNLFNLSNINDLFQKLVASGMVTTSATIPARETPPVQNHREKTRHNFKQSKKHPPLKPVSFDKPEQLKVRQGALYEKLYVGMQCSSCGMRFPPEQSLYYSQHLDWHFRQNRKGKKNARVASSRKWYYSLSDWTKYEEIEDLDEREKNFFDQQQQAENTAEEAAEETELPSVTADPELQDICDVCGDKFEIFFHEDKEEWHMKNAVRDEDKIYHPICYEEHQQSLLKAALVQDEIEDKQDTNEVEQIPGIEIVLDDDEETEKTEEVVDEVILDESDESKLTNSDEKKEEPMEYEDEDDDVIIKEETIEQIILDDDDDKQDDEEFSQPSPPEPSPSPKEPAEVIDDGFVDVNEGLLMLQNGGPVKVKSEPIDDGYMMDVNAFETSLEEDKSREVEEPKEPELDQIQTQSAFVPSMDGNLEMDSSAPTPVVSNVCGKIKINIHKPLPVIPPKTNNKDLPSESDTLPESVIDPSQPLPPGEEPILLKLKPALQGVELKKMPKVQKGSELSGMCTIM